MRKAWISLLLLAFSFHGRSNDESRQAISDWYYRYRTTSKGELYDFGAVLPAKEKPWAKRYWIEGDVLKDEGDGGLLVLMNKGNKVVPRINPLLMSSEEQLNMIGSANLANQFLAEGKLPPSVFELKGIRIVPDQELGRIMRAPKKRAGEKFAGFVIPYNLKNPNVVSGETPTFEYTIAATNRTGFTNIWIVGPVGLVKKAMTFE